MREHENQPRINTTGICSFRYYPRTHKYLVNKYLHTYGLLKKIYSIFIYVTFLNNKNYYLDIDKWIIEYSIY